MNRITFSNQIIMMVIEEEEIVKVYSVNDEDFNYTEISDLLNDYPELEVGSVIYLAEAKKPTIESLVDADDIIDLMIDRAYDYGGEYAESWCFDVSMQKNAKKTLNESIKRWAKKYLPAVDFYTVGKSDEYVLKEEDFE